MPIVCDPKGVKSGRDRQLDYKRAFTYWLEFGTVKRATLAMEKDGYLLTKKDGTKKPFSTWAIQLGAWVWVIENPEESLVIWQSKGFFQKGRDEEWKRWISAKIRTYMKPRASMERALEINGIKEWYDETYGFDDPESK